MPEYVAIDLETTGLDPLRDRLIEVGAVVFSSAGVTLTLDRLVDPGRSVPDAVLRLTGIRPNELRGAAAATAALADLADLMRDREPIGHGATLDVDFLTAAGVWPPGREIIDTLHLARILLPNSPSHSLPSLAAELGLEQPRPHRAFDDADATRQLFTRLCEIAGALDERLKESMLALVAPYDWAVARVFADALTASNPAADMLSAGRARRGTPALRPTVPWDIEAIGGLLLPEGPLATAFPGYEHRESQLQMLLAVAQIFERGGSLVVEAGTGTGKSIAYLIPAIARALAKGEKVIISTATHTLQEQLINKDLPFLREWLPWQFEAVLLKGRANYLSLRRWRRYLGEPCLDAEELRFKLKLLVWLHQTASGDRSELRLQGREEVLWARVASDPLDCVGMFCTAEDCYVHRARAEAEKADLVIVNHALLLADAAQGGGVLPDFQHLVIDEAHHLEDAATQGLRREVDGPALVALIERLASLVGMVAARPRLGVAVELRDAGPAADDARGRILSLFEHMGHFVRGVLADPGRRDETLRLGPGLRGREGWAQLRDLADDAATALAGLDAQLRRAAAGGREWLGGEEPDQNLREMEIIRVRVAQAASLLHEALAEPDANQVYWFTLMARTANVVLRSAPLNVGGLLREHVFAPRDTVIFTSASLAVGGSFDYFRQRVGLDREPEMLVLASPFDYLSQALVCLPSGLPDPQSEEFSDAVVEVIADVARRIGGRTLALFTSHRQLRDTYFEMKQRHDLDDILILGQGLDGQRRQVLDTFRASERALLLGTSSFWEGIDVPGDQLSCVVMVRLPFPVPTEPVFAARAEQVADSFSLYALPMAALKLKQGFGRLIRRSTDRGAVVILDNRISSRDYGRAFLEVLPRGAMYTGPALGVGER
ncbi:MAG: exonuclease domain-containing protein, partial [Candidatus Dormibacteraeota bacterium]|nr:exonuclease domain-containing protein [Candidatus Dormibacteraeota bacterium]